MKRIAVLFSGQGSQYPGMGRKLHERDAATRELFEQASSLLDLDMRRLCFEGSGEELQRTENTQPALLLCSVAAWREFSARTGLVPAFMAGHSLGELSALVAAGALPFEDGLRLARARGLAMSRCGEPGRMGMLAVTQLPLAQLQALCADVAGFGSDFVVANLNAPQQGVLSGRLDALERAGAALRAAGAATIPLKVGGPFHSPFMAPAAEALAQALAGVRFARPRVPVIANVDAAPHGEGAAIAASLARQLTGTVRWSETMALLYAQSVDAFVEAGPRGVLKRLAQANVPGARAFALDEDEDQAPLEAEFAAELRAMRERPSLVTKCLAVAVCTRNHNHDEAAYQQGVVEPYRQLQALQERLESEAREPDAAEMRQALALLARIFATKGTPAEEVAWRFEQILRATGADRVLGPDFELPAVAAAAVAA